MLLWLNQKGFPGGKESACLCRRLRFDSWVGKSLLVEEMATHSSILAWRILWTESLRCCSPWGCKRVGYDLETEQQLSQTAGRMDSFCSKDRNSPRSLREGFLKTVLAVGIVGGVISLYTILWRLVVRWSGVYIQNLLVTGGLRYVLVGCMHLTPAGRGVSLCTTQDVA